MHTPPLTTRLAALHDQERHLQAARAHAIRRAQAVAPAVAPGTRAQAQAAVTPVVTSAGTAARSAIISLLMRSRRARPSIG
jgi:hypothetical protein